MSTPTPLVAQTITTATPAPAPATANPTVATSTDATQPVTGSNTPQARSKADKRRAAKERYQASKANTKGISPSENQSEANADKGDSKSSADKPNASPSGANANAEKKATSESNELLLPILQQSATPTTVPFRVGGKIQNKPVSELSCRLTNNFFINPKDLPLLKKLSQKYLAEDPRQPYSVTSVEIVKKVEETTKDLFLAEVDGVGTNVFTNRDLSNTGLFLPYGGVIRIVKKSEIESAQGEYQLIYISIDDYYLIVDASNYRSFGGFVADGIADDEKVQQELFEITNQNVKAQPCNLNRINLYLSDKGIILPYLMDRPHSKLRKGEMLTYAYTPANTELNISSLLNYWVAQGIPPRIHLGFGKFAPEDQVLFKVVKLKLTCPQGIQYNFLTTWDTLRNSANLKLAEGFDELRFAFQDNSTRNFVFTASTLNKLLEKQGKLFLDSSVDCVIDEGIHQKLQNRILEILGKDITKHLKKDDEWEFRKTNEGTMMKLKLGFPIEIVRKHTELLLDHKISTYYLDDSKDKRPCYLVLTSECILSSVQNQGFLPWHHMSEEMQDLVPTRKKADIKRLAELAQAKAKLQEDEARVQESTARFEELTRLQQEVQQKLQANVLRLQQLEAKVAHAQAQKSQMAALLSSSSSPSSTISSLSGEGTAGEALTENVNNSATPVIEAQQSSVTTIALQEIQSAFTTSNTALVAMEAPHNGAAEPIHFMHSAQQKEKSADKKGELSQSSPKAHSSLKL